MFELTISDLLYFLEEVIYDFRNLEHANLISLGFRLLLIYFVIILSYKILSVLLRIFKETFGGLFVWLWRFLLLPYHIPKSLFQRLAARRHARRLTQERERQQLRWEAQQQEELDQKKREVEIFEKIMKN